MEKSTAFNRGGGAYSTYEPIEPSELDPIDEEEI
jgi:hypothetical protein